MSRLAKRPMPIPAGAKLTLKGQTLKVIGPKGVLATRLPSNVSVSMDESGQNLLFTCQNEQDRKNKQMHGLSYGIIGNMLTGVTLGFEKHLELQGVGYRAAKQGDNLSINIGFSKPVIFEPPRGIKLDLLNPTNLLVRGIDLQQVGAIAAKIRAIRPPDAYKGKGIRYGDEQVRLKAGKGGKKK
ncbi:50S ribosomal protein L6 [Sphaeroforma arctica JP610]|uniref:50S ribosomal protein L6 n=1 Tax=Sphaeroforma arctica JP610 TaxID=667725 RepID=A0A0L0GB35_9EUKA|nr:50S ribosomal protein L6 [Sphaeroforma arctica JP610]KNC85478.1 50S ribosomal protein L6 [Sphaeroforma arctica JP610]|eukprot:XP_014159380.1 50S ribosomal protein L6 [Sphaeroforma arctica JP610]